MKRATNYRKIESNRYKCSHSDNVPVFHEICLPKIHLTKETTEKLLYNRREMRISFDAENIIEMSRRY